MFTIAIIAVATFLVHTHSIYCLHIIEIIPNNIFKNVKIPKQRLQIVEIKLPKNPFAKLLKKNDQRLYREDRRSSIYKQINKLNEREKNNQINKGTIQNYLALEHISNRKRQLLKSYSQQIALNDKLNEGQRLNKDIRNNLNDYSKIYLLLNPQSNLSSSDVRNINGLVSSLFSKAVFNKKATFKDKGIRRYKGFVIRDYRRRFKKSQEIFVPKDSIENDYKPKRGRSDYRGGGGRTAIPYVRHRGDIYEKD